MAAKTIRRKISRGKSWFKVHAPKSFNEKPIGETLGKDGDSIIGRCLMAHYSEITGELSKQYIRIKLRIISVTGENAHTEIVGYELSKPYLQRIIRRRISKIDVVKDLKLKDGQKVRIKALAATQFKTHVSKKNAMYDAFSKEIEKEISKFDIESLVMALSTNQLQKEIQKRLNKVYPTRYVDVRKIEILKDSKKISSKTKKKESKEETEEKEVEESNEEIKEELPEEIVEESDNEEVSEEAEEEESTKESNE